MKTPSNHEIITLLLRWRDKIIEHRAIQDNVEDDFVKEYHRDCASQLGICIEELAEIAGITPHLMELDEVECVDTDTLPELLFAELQNTHTTTAAQLDRSPSGSKANVLQGAHTGLVPGGPGFQHQNETDNRMDQPKGKPSVRPPVASPQAAQS